MGFWGISFQNRDVLWNFEAGSSQIWGEMGETIAEYGHMVKPMAWLFPVKNWIILDLVSTGRLECVWKQDIASSLGYIDLGIIYIYTHIMLEYHDLTLLFDLPSQTPKLWSKVSCIWIPSWTPYFSSSHISKRRAVDHSCLMYYGGPNN